MAKRRPSASPRPAARRIPPSRAPAEAVERIVPRGQLTLEDGDVVIIRELLPRLTRGLLRPQWRYRVVVYPEIAGAPTFTSFAAAAGHGETQATERGARLMFVEDHIPSLLANYRRS